MALNEQVIARLNCALLGNDSAVRLNAALIDTLHVWDDLVDKDKPVPPEEVSRAFRMALVTIPANAFYRQHFVELHPLLDVLILNWMTATRMERDPEGETDRHIAFVIRSDYCNFLLKSMVIAGGFDHAMRTWPEVRRFWHQEGYENYVRGLDAEREAREGNQHVLF